MYDVGNRIRLGNLSPDELKEVFALIVHQNKIPKVKSFMIFGITCTKNFNARMSKYNHGGFERAPHNNINHWLLMRAGDKFRLANGTVVTVNFDDIRIMEMVAVFEFNHGKFKEHSNKIMNTIGGANYLCIIFFTSFTLNLYNNF